MNADIGGLRRAVEQCGVAVRVSVIVSEGSTPRETGAAMLVTPGETAGTVGGGALEHEAIAAARRLMAGEPAPWRREVLSFPLGPSLGQCCGGRVKLLLEAFTAHELAALTSDTGGSGCAVLLRPTGPGAALTIVTQRKTCGDWPTPVQRLLDEMLSGQRPAAPTLVRGRRDAADWYIEPLSQSRAPLFLYGAGHVGRAVVRVLERLPFAVSWIDVVPERFPPAIPPAVCAIAERDPAATAASAPAEAWHLVMTYSHPLDLAICHAVMQQGAFRYLGLIGSMSKRTRFLRRLAGLGVAPDMLARLHCPIGLEGLRGKEPDVIAVSVAADLLRRAGGAKATTEYRGRLNVGYRGQTPRVDEADLIDRGGEGSDPGAERGRR